jgi:hypothetical protein
MISAGSGLPEPPPAREEQEAKEDEDREDRESGNPGAGT